MSTVQTLQISSTRPDDTVRIGEQIGSQLRGGEVLVLRSDVGGGKTTLTRGIAKGIGSKDHVHSPSFTISNHYQGATLQLYHLDFYRLNNPGIMAIELAEYLDQPDAVVVIEWADIVAEVLPVEYITITIQTTDEEGRSLTLSYPETLAYSINNLTS